MVERLAALVPPPQFSLVRYHGVLAAASAWESLRSAGRCEQAWNSFRMWARIAIETHILESIMRTVQMTLEDGLVEQVDKLARKLKTTRSAFTRDALRLAIRKYTVAESERKHRKGYETHPVAAAEFSVWESEQAWGDE